MKWKIQMIVGLWREGVRKFVEWIRSGKIEVRINIIGGNKTLTC
jgi:hypothetical protein